MNILLEIQFIKKNHFYTSHEIGNTNPNYFPMLHVCQTKTTEIGTTAY